MPYTHLDIDCLKIQDSRKRRSINISLRIRNNSIRNIKSTIPMHTALIFKEQAKVKTPGLREKGLAQPHYSVQHIEWHNFLCCKENIYIPQSLRQKKSTVLVP
jgi:hypothetical protein